MIMSLIHKYQLKLMKINKLNKKIPLDKFLEKALYEPEIGYYNKKNPFGKDGDFVTSPTISNLFSEILAIWIISLWENLGSPKQINIIELGAGSGEMISQILKTIEKIKKTANLDVVGYRRV